jgi:hypothetical protein
MGLVLLVVFMLGGTAFAQDAAPVAPPAVAASADPGPAALPAVPAGPAPATNVAATLYDSAVAEAIASSEKDDTIPPTTQELMDAGKKVYNDWAKLGWMAGIAALCGFLLLLLRYKPLDDMLTNKDWKKWKPWVSAVLGSVSGFFSSYLTGVGWMPSIITGLMAGLAIVGLHQGITGVAKPKEPSK